MNQGASFDLGSNGLLPFIDTFEGDLRKFVLTVALSVSLGRLAETSRRDGRLTCVAAEDSSSNERVLDALLKRTRVARLSITTDELTAVLFRHEEKVFGLRGPLVELFVSE
jgi:hypothetical protein